MPDQIVNYRQRVRIKNEFVVLRAKQLGDAPGEGCLVKVRFAEANGKGLYGAGRQLRHGSNHGAGIHSTAQEGAKGHITVHPDPHGFIQQFAKPPDAVLLALIVIRFKAHVPVAAFLRRLAGLHGQDVTWLQLVDALNDAFIARRGEKREQVSHRCPVEVPLHLRQLQQALELGGEYQPPGNFAIEQRFDAQAIPGQHQALAAVIPEGKAKHPAQLVNAVRTVFFVEVDDNLGIGLRVECVAPALQLRAQFPVVVDLPIEHDLNAAILIGHRLMTGLQIDDTQPAHAQANRSINVEAFVIRPPVNHHIAHRLDVLEGGG